MASSGSRDWSIATLVQRFSKACLNTTRDESVLVSRLCEVGKAYLQEKARTLIQNAVGQPVLVHYSSDGTPLSSKKHIKAVSSNFSSSKLMRDTDEYLVQHVFYRTIDALGTPSTVTLLRDPLPLSCGKTALAQYSCGKSFFQNARQLGHVGISIATYTWDRAGYSALARIWRNHHTMMAPDFAAPEQGLDSASLSLLEWVETTPCCQHDCHNSLKWSLHSFFNNVQLVQEMFIIVAAVRNSYMLIHQHLAAWLQSKLALVPDSELPPVQTRQELWTALGVEPGLVELLAHKLRLQWKGGQLEVAESCTSIPDLLESISSALLGLWQFPQFCGSRWVTIGTSCRCLVAAWLSGFDSLVAFTRSDPKASDFHIHGYGKLTPEHRRFVAIAALSAYPTEAVLTEMMVDSRLARRLPELEEAIAVEQAFLSGISSPVWAAIGEVCDMSPRQLCNEVLSAAHTASGFLRTRCFNLASQLPWKLGVGDIGQNLAELAAGPEPLQPTANKIWKLLALGYNTSQLHRALLLLMDTPWGTASVEQQHASASLMRRFHPEIGQESLMARSFVHSFRHLMPSTDMEQRRVEAQRQRLLQLLKHKRPQAIAARQVFVKDLMGVARDRKAAGPKKANTGLPVQKVIMKQHGARWQKLSAKAKSKYEAKAASERLLSQEAWDESVASEAGILSVMASRLEAARAQQQHPPLLLSAGKLCSEDLERMQAMLANPDFTDKQVSLLREASRVAPSPPNPQAAAALQQHVIVEPELPARPEWLGPVCWNRSFFHNCAFAFDVGEQRVWYKFVYATQSPLFACFSKLELEDHHMPMVTLTGSNWNEVGAGHFDHRFVADLNQATPWHDLPAVPMEAIQVLTHLQHLGGVSVVSVAELAPLSRMLAIFPPPAATARAASAEAKVSPNEAKGLLEKHPFLQGILAKPHAGSSSSNEPADPLAEEPVDVEGNPLTSDEHLQALFEELEQKREEWLDEGGGNNGDFKVILIGGQFLLRKTGQAYEAFRGQAKQDSRGFAWCKQYGLQTSAKFHLNIFGEEASCAMANAWCHRMRYFFDLWEASGEESYTYTPEDRAGYVEEAWFTALAGDLVGRAFERLQWLRSLAP